MRRRGEARVRRCWQVSNMRTEVTTGLVQGTHRGPQKGRIWVGLGSRGPTRGGSAEGAGLGARVAQPARSPQATPRLDSGPSAQVVMAGPHTPPRRTPCPSPLPQCSVLAALKTQLYVALHGGNPSRLPASPHEHLSPSAKLSGPRVSRSLTQFPSLPLSSLKPALSPHRSPSNPSFLPLLRQFSLLE